MQTSALFSMLVVLSLSAGAVFAAAPDKSAGGPNRVLRHVVMYKFVEGQSKAEQQELIDAFCKLPKQVDSVIGFEHGPNVSEEGKSDGLQYVFVVTFKDEAGRAAYLKHPAHSEYVKVAGKHRDHVVVMDYWAEK